MIPLQGVPLEVFHADINKKIVKVIIKEPGGSSV